MTPLSDSPSFGQQEPCFGLGKVDNLSYVVVGEIDAVDLSRKFPRQQHSHQGMNKSNPCAAHPSRRGACFG